MKKNPFLLAFVFFTVLIDGATNPFKKKLFIGVGVTASLLTVSAGFAWYRFLKEVNEMNEEVGRGKQDDLNYLNQINANFQNECNVLEQKNQDGLFSLNNKLDEANKKLQGVQSLYNEQQGTLNGLSGQLQQDESDIKKLQGDFEVAKKTNSMSNERLNQLDGGYRALNSRIEPLKNEMIDLQNKINYAQGFFDTLKRQYNLLSTQCQQQEHIVKSLRQDLANITEQSAQVANQYENSYNQIKVMVASMLHQVGVSLFYANNFSENRGLAAYKSFIDDGYFSDGFMFQGDKTVASDVFLSNVSDLFLPFIEQHKELIREGWQRRTKILTAAERLKDLAEGKQDNFCVSSSEALGGVSWDVAKILSFLDGAYNADVYYATMDDAQKIGFFSQIFFGNANMVNPCFQGELAWEGELLKNSITTFDWFNDHKSLVPSGFLKATFDGSYKLLHTILSNGVGVMYSKPSSILRSVCQLFDLFCKKNISLDGECFCKIGTNGKIVYESNPLGQQGWFEDSNIENVFSCVDNGMKEHTPMVYFATKEKKRIFMTSDAHSTYVPLLVEEIIKGESIQISAGDVHDRLPDKGKGDPELWSSIFRFSNFTMWWVQKIMAGYQLLLKNRVVFVPGNHELMASNVSILMAKYIMPDNFRDKSDDEFSSQVTKKCGLYNGDLFLFLSRFGFFSSDSSKQINDVFAIDRYAFFINMLIPKMFIIDNHGELVVGHHGAFSPWLTDQVENSNAAFKFCLRSQSAEVENTLRAQINNKEMQERFPQLFKNSWYDNYLNKLISQIFTTACQGDGQHFEDKNKPLPFNQIIKYLPELWCDFVFEILNEGFYERRRGGRVAIHQELLEMLTIVSVNYFLRNNDALTKKMTLLIGHSQSTYADSCCGLINYVNRKLGVPISINSFESFSIKPFRYPGNSSSIISLLMKPENYFYGIFLEKLWCNIKDNNSICKIFVVPSGVAASYFFNAPLLSSPEERKKLFNAVFNNENFYSLFNKDTYNVNLIKQELDTVFQEMEILLKNRIAICKKIPFILSHNGTGQYQLLSLEEFHTLKGVQFPNYKPINCFIGCDQLVEKGDSFGKSIEDGAFHAMKPEAVKVTSVNVSENLQNKQQQVHSILVKAGEGLYGTNVNQQKGLVQPQYFYLPPSQPQQNIPQKNIPQNIVVQPPVVQQAPQQQLYQQQPLQQQQQQMPQQPLSAKNLVMENLKKAINNADANNASFLQEYLFKPYERSTDFLEILNQITNDQERINFQAAYSYFYSEQNFNYLTIKWNLFKEIYLKYPESHAYYEGKQHLPLIRDILLHLCFGSYDQNNSIIGKLKNTLDQLSYEQLIDHNTMSTYEGFSHFRTILSLQGSYFFYLTVKSGMDLLSWAPEFDDNALPWERELYGGLRDRVNAILRDVELVNNGYIHTIFGGNDSGESAGGICIEKGSGNMCPSQVACRAPYIDDRVDGIRIKMAELTSVCPIHFTCQRDDVSKKEYEPLVLTDFHSTYGGFPLFFNTINEYVTKFKANKGDTTRGIKIYHLGDFIDKVPKSSEIDPFPQDVGYISNFCNFLQYLYGIHTQFYLNYLFRKKGIAIRIASVQGNHEANTSFLPGLFTLKKDGCFGEKSDVFFKYCHELVNFVSKIGIFNVNFPTALVNAAKVDNLLAGTSYLAPSGIFSFCHGKINTGQHSICPQPLILQKRIEQDRDGSLLVGIRVGEFYKKIVANDVWWMERITSIFGTYLPLFFPSGEEYNLFNTQLFPNYMLYFLNKIWRIIRYSGANLSPLIKCFMQHNAISRGMVKNFRDRPNQFSDVNDQQLGAPGGDSIKNLFDVMNHIFENENGSGMNALFSFYDTMISKWCDLLLSVTSAGQINSGTGRAEIIPLLFSFVYIFNYAGIEDLFTVPVRHIQHSFGHSHSGNAEKNRFNKNNTFDSILPTKCAIFSVKKTAGNSIRINGTVNTFSLYDILKRSTSIDYAKVQLLFSSAGSFSQLIRAPIQAGCQYCFILFGNAVFCLNDFGKTAISPTVERVCGRPPATVENLFTYPGFLDAILSSFPGYEREKAVLDSYDFTVINKKFCDCITEVVERYKMNKAFEPVSGNVGISPVMETYAHSVSVNEFNNTFESFIRDATRLTGLMEVFRVNRCMTSMIGGYWNQGVAERLNDPLFILISEYVRFMSKKYFGYRSSVKQEGWFFDRATQQNVFGTMFDIPIKPKALVFLEALALLAHEVNFYGGDSNDPVSQRYDKVYRDHEYVGNPLQLAACNNNNATMNEVNRAFSLVSFLITSIHAMDNFTVFGDPHTSIQSGFSDKYNIIVGDILDKPFFKGYAAPNNSFMNNEKFNRYHVRFQLIHFVSSIMYNILFQSGLPYKLYLRGNHESTFNYQCADGVKDKYNSIPSYIFSFINRPILINNKTITSLYSCPQSYFIGGIMPFDSNNKYIVSSEITFLNNRLADVMRKVFHYGLPIAAVGVSSNSKCNIFHHTMFLPNFNFQNKVSSKISNNNIENIVGTITINNEFFIDNDLFLIITDCFWYNVDVLLPNPYAFSRFLKDSNEFSTEKRIEIFFDCFNNFFSKVCQQSSNSFAMNTIWFGHEQGAHSIYQFLKSGLENKSVMADLRVNANNKISNVILLDNNSPSRYYTIVDEEIVDYAPQKASLNNVRCILTALGPDANYSFTVNNKLVWSPQGFSLYDFFPSLGITNLNLITVVDEKTGTIKTGYYSIAKKNRELININNIVSTFHDEDSSGKLTNFITNVAKCIQGDPWVRDVVCFPLDQRKDWFGSSYINQETIMKHKKVILATLGIMRKIKKFYNNIQYNVQNFVDCINMLHELTKLMPSSNQDLFLHTFTFFQRIHKNGLPNNHCIFGIPVTNNIVAQKNSDNAFLEKINEIQALQNTILQ